MAIAPVRHEEGVDWQALSLAEIEARTKVFLETPEIRPRIPSLSTNEEPDNAERFGDLTRTPELVAEQVAAIIAGADAAGWSGEWVAPATNAWDSVGMGYAEKLRTELEKAGVANRFSRVGYHCYPQGDPNARTLLADGAKFLHDLWSLPVIADQIAVTPTNQPAQMAVWSWFVMAHYESLGGW